jgi:hypothetical protein
MRKDYQDIEVDLRKGVTSLGCGNDLTNHATASEHRTIDRRVR